MIKGRNKLILAVFFLVLAMLACGDAPSYVTLTPSPVSTVDLSTVEDIFKVWSIGPVYNGATAPATFTIYETWDVREILTYHWNDGQGAPPGTIGLKAADGTMYGPYQTNGLEGQGGVPNAYWVRDPMINLPPGTYTVIDSDPGTWSQNEETGGVGITWVKGIRQGNP